jgi:predicted HAD superfamily hydrolase
MPCQAGSSRTVEVSMVEQENGQTGDLDAFEVSRNKDHDNFKIRAEEQKGYIRELEEIIREKEQHIEGLELRLKETIVQLDEKESELGIIYHSRGWKALLKFYAARDRILPPGTRRRTVVIKLLRAGKDFLSRKRILVKSRGDHFSSGSLDDVKRQERQPGRIAIHLHLYYKDLLEELVKSFVSMPYSFDLFITVTGESDPEEIELRVRNLLSTTGLDTLTVVVVPNRGRDIAPFLKVFETRFRNYDYVCHLHSKKSLFTGHDQYGWRKYLFKSLLGSSNHIRTIFGLFEEDKRVGVVYPSTYKLMPYWAHSWLSNRQSAGHLGDRLGLAFALTRYVDFPVGSMFWARTKALQPLFTAGIDYDDFHAEPMPNDGTISHAIERSICLVARSQGFSFTEIDIERNTYSIGIGNKNLDQYWNRSLSDTETAIRAFSAVSFDIFDTLTTRPLLDPDHAFMLLEEKIDREFSIRSNFCRIRKEAESTARQKLKSIGDVTMAMIYSQFRDASGLDTATVDRIMEMEMEYEHALSLPRACLIDLAKSLVANGKKVALLSDMYLASESIRKMLEKHGFDTSGTTMAISCETGRRKDTGQIWRTYRSNMAQLHIGDNEHSDIQLPGDRGIQTCHVMSPVRLFEHFGPLERTLPEVYSLADSIYLGPVVARLFSDPFRLHPHGRLTISDPREMGYCLLGPILLHFTAWLFKKVHERRIDHLFFLAREGFLLKKIYDLFVERLGRPGVETTYLLCSRRGVSVPAITEKSDIEELLEANYAGSLAVLLEARFGIEEHGKSTRKDTLSNYFKLPNDRQVLLEEISKYEGHIMQNAAEERRCYQDYLKSVGVFSAHNAAVVDIGYSGTIQKNLSRISSKNFCGFYFVTSKNARALPFSDSLFGCFGHFISHNEGNYIYKYSLILESVLTAEEGQFTRFIKESGNLVPVHNNNGPAGLWPTLEAIQGGIMSYISDTLGWFGDSVLEHTPAQETIQYFFRLFCDHPEILDAHLLEKLKIDDFYASGRIIPASYHILPRK